MEDCQLACSTNKKRPFSGRFEEKTDMIQDDYDKTMRRIYPDQEPPQRGVKTALRSQDEPYEFKYARTVFVAFDKEHLKRCAEAVHVTLSDDLQKVIMKVSALQQKDLRDFGTSFTKVTFDGADLVVSTIPFADVIKPT